MSLQKYSLWLMPTGDVARTFSRIISRLAEQYASPTFTPHVTLLGSIETSEQDVITRSGALASLIHPFTIRLTSVGYSDQYFRALFVRVDPTDALLAAYQEACKAFPKLIKPDYMPHLSLLYGNLPVEVKQRGIEEIGGQFSDEFYVESLHLYLTEGLPDAWREVRQFSLTV
jgi:2'-5' RNA ligase